MSKVIYFVAIAYLLAGILALLAIPASAYAWLGMEPDPLSAVFALLLSLPWALLLRLFDIDNPILAGALCTAGIAFNATLLFLLGKKLA